MNTYKKIKTIQCICRLCLLSEKLLSLIFSIYNIAIHYKKLKEKKKSNCRHNPFNSGIPLIENIA